MKHLPIGRSLTDRVYDAILDAICDGELASGQKITQDELALKLNVSRQPVVQALFLLKMQGFVQDSGRRGIVVTPLEPAFISHLYEVRSALDGAACRGAALRGRDDAKLWGAKLIADGRSIAATGSIKQMIEADMRFHLFLYELSGNPIISETAELHWRHIRRVMGSYLLHYRARNSIWDEHQAILDAVVAGDANAAEMQARRHADHALANLIPLLAQDQEKLPGKDSKPTRRRT